MNLIIGDAVNYVIEEAKDESFDVIIVDSSDPDGPAEKLFSEEFYKNASRILTKGISLKFFVNYYFYYFSVFQQCSININSQLRFRGNNGDTRRMHLDT